MESKALELLLRQTTSGGRGGDSTRFMLGPYTVMPLPFTACAWQQKQAEVCPRRRTATAAGHFGAYTAAGRRFAMIGAGPSSWES